MKQSSIVWVTKNGISCNWLLIIIYIHISNYAAHKLWSDINTTYVHCFLSFYCTSSTTLTSVIGTVPAVTWPSTNTKPSRTISRRYTMLTIVSSSYVGIVVVHTWDPLPNSGGRNSADLCCPFVATGGSRLAIAEAVHQCTAPLWLASGHLSAGQRIGLLNLWFHKKRRDYSMLEDCRNLLCCSFAWPIQGGSDYTMRHSLSQYLTLSNSVSATVMSSVLV